MSMKDWRRKTNKRKGTTHRETHREPMYRLGGTRHRKGGQKYDMRRTHRRMSRR